MKALGDGLIPLPPIGFGAHLIGYLFEVGPVASNGMGTGPVSFAELKAWQSACGHSLTGWEFQVLREMSANYAEMLQKGEDPNAPRPWVEVLDADKQSKLVPHIKSVLRG